MSRHDLWASYLDPEGTEARPPEAECEALDRIRGVLADPATWSEPPDDLTARVLARAAFDPVDEAPAEADLAADADTPDSDAPSSPDLIGPAGAGVGTDEAARADGTAAGAGAAGDAGVAGTAGDAGVAGTAGDAGVAGTAGDAGVAGTAGDAGVAGTAADERATAGTVGAEAAEGTPPVVPLAPRRRRRWLVPAASGIAAAVAAVLALVFWPGGSPTHYSVAGTAFEPAATATVTVDPRPAGVAMTMRIKGLPPSTDDTYYAVWLRGDAGTVPVGSFHWRKSGEPIDLWSGVDPSRYPTFFVTRQREGAPPTPSTEIVLQGVLKS